MDDETLSTDRLLAPYYRWIKEGRARSGSATVALGAAMVAVGEILEPEKTSVEIEQPAGDPHSADGLDRFAALHDRIERRIRSNTSAARAFVDPV